MTEHPKFSTKCDQRRQLVVKLQRHLTVPAGQMRDRGRDIGIEKRAIDALGAAAAPHDELADIGEASSLRMIAGAAAAVARRARGEPGALIADTISAGGQLACDASVSSSGQPLTGVPSSRRWGGCLRHDDQMKATTSPGPSGRLEHACAGSHFVRRVDNGCRLAGVSAYSDRSDSTGHAPAPGT